MRSLFRDLDYEKRNELSITMIKRVFSELGLSTTDAVEEAFKQFANPSTGLIDCTYIIIIYLYLLTLTVQLSAPSFQHLLRSFPIDLISLIGLYTLFIYSICLFYLYCLSPDIRFLEVLEFDDEYFLTVRFATGLNF